MSFDYKGRTALVTGASMGIGECMARELAERGAHLVLVARSKEKLQALAAELRSRHGVMVHVMPADLSRTEGPHELMESVLEAGIEVDLLVNNAGLGDFGMFEEQGTSKMTSLIDLNVRALVVLTRLFLKPMQERGKGGILNIASTAAFQPIPKLALYSASKAFVLSFTEAIWSELKGSGIRVMCLCPGNTESRFHETAGIPPKYRFLQVKTIDLVRHGLRVFSETDRPTTIHGFLNWLLAFGNRLAPRRLVLAITSSLYR